MIEIKNLPDAWEMIERIGGEEAKEKEDLYDIYYKISTALFDYRLKYELSQKKLAEKLGVTQPMVAKLESGDYNYTIEQLWKIATKLGFKFSIDFQETETEISVISRSESRDNVVDYDVEYMAVGA